ncbi:MAG: hypothetical protein ACR2K5_14960, partial [Pseudolabrys sp.]
TLFLPSFPALCRSSTPFLNDTSERKDVDGRDKPGHDKEGKSRHRRDLFDAMRQRQSQAFIPPPPGRGRAGG